MKQEIKISHEKPPIFDTLVERFGIRWENVVITYGDTVHSKEPQPDEIIAHEKVHVQQQLAMGVEEWWRRYLEDPEFRKSQEAPAYQRQWQFIKTHEKNRERAFKRKLKITQDFSGAMYGHICSFQEATKIIGK